MIICKKILLFIVFMATRASEGVLHVFIGLCCYLLFYLLLNFI